MKQVDKLVHHDWFSGTREYEIVNEWPRGYFVWNIGRRNFPYPGYIPLTVWDDPGIYSISIDKVKALYVGDEELCLKVLKAAHRGVNPFQYDDFLKLKNDYENTI